MLWSRILAVVATAGLLASHARANEDAALAKAREIDTQFIFGWTQGADVGEAHEQELEFQNNIFVSKRAGRYAAVQSQMRYETAPIENLRLELGAPFIGHDISGVPGLDHRSTLAFQGLSAEARYKLLSRDKAPVGLTVGVEPHWSRIDDTSGERVQSYGAEFTLAADRELVEDKVYAAANLSFDPEISRARGAPRWERQSTLGASFSLTRLWAKGVFFGGEARWLRAYDGARLNRYAGQALFVGPTFLVALSERVMISGAWSYQIVGGEHGSSAAFDLANFSRHQATLRAEYNF
jgi:hypothetical protein